ncbi:hypothetical protein ACOSQ2_021769 [Xanthoceras sorbifolium]
MNQALLAKAGWRLLQGDGGLYCTKAFFGGLEKGRISSFGLISGLRIVCAICVIRSDSGKDRQIWGLEKNGCFSVKSAYKVACSDDNIDLWDWRSLWKLKLPPKISYFLWLVCHGKLLTNSQRIIRGISNDAYCPRCNSADENILYLFRGCTASIRVWEDTPICPALIIFRYCKEWLLATALPNKDLSPRTQLGVWQSPKEGWVKINVDGGRNTVNGSIYTGGVLRGYRGVWLGGFSSKIGTGSVLEAELWAALEGLQMAWRSGARKQCTIAHIFREGNAVADCLAGLSKNRERRTAYFQSPPPEIASLLECDAGNLLNSV